MGGGSNGVRLGAVVDRDLVAERIASRTAPLPPLAAPGPVHQAPPDPPPPGPAVAGVLVDEVDYGLIAAARTPTGIGLAAFVARAAIDAARRHPKVCSGSGPVHLGVDGRVVRDADALRLRALAAAIDGAAEVEGATIVIVDGSGDGVRTIVVPPAADAPCLGIGRVTTRPVARSGPDAEWAMVMRPVGDLSLSFDHRRIDASDAAAFLTDVRQSLEERAWEVEL